MGNTRSTAKVVRQGDYDLEAIIADPEAAARDLTQIERTEALVGLARMVRDLRSELAERVDSDKFSGNSHFPERHISQEVTFP